MLARFRHVLLLCSAGAVLGVVLGMPPAPASGFVTVDVSASLAAAPRWSPTEVFGRGLADGVITVRITTDFAEEIALAVTGQTAPQDIADIEAVVVAAFRAWESPVLRFDLVFDGATVRDPGSGGEIDLFTVLSTDPDFAASGANFGVTFMLWTFAADRTLTNGTVLAGNTIFGADILIAKDRLALIAPGFTREEQVRSLQRLLMHELGHAIGLHHPHDGPAVNFDTDTNPNNAILVDPADPLAGMILSPNLDTLAVMNQIPSDFNGLFYISLRNDDRGGRDVLYPAPGATQLVCQPSPAAGCRTALVSKLQIRDDGDDGKDKLVWKWVKGTATMAAEFGAPAGATRYSLCLYRGALPALVGEVALPPGASWSPTAKGHKYRDPARQPHGVQSAVLNAGVQDKSKVVVKGAGMNLPDGRLPLGTAPVTAQLLRADTMACWGSEYQTADITADSGGLFKAKRK